MAAYVRVSGEPGDAKFVGEMLPLLSTTWNENGFATRGVSSTLTVSTHSVGPPDTAYVTPASTGNGAPPLKSEGVTPVTGALKVAVTVTSLPVGVVDAVVSVGTGGRSGGLASHRAR